MSTEHPADAALARAAWRLVPLAMAIYIASFIDRVNVGFAALTMNKALGFSPEVYGFGAGIFFLSYSMFEVPSNLMMERFGARTWMCRIMVAWGLLSMLTAFVTGPISFYSIRFILGLAEAGFVPGILLYFTYWFPVATRSRITALFTMGIPLSNVIGAPISSYFLGIDAFDLHGWQWMFIAEGLPSLLLGAIVYLWLPDGPATARWLMPEEKRAILAHLAEQPKRELHSFGAMLSDWRVWALALPDFCIAFGLYCLGLWLPQMVKGLGHDAAHTGWIVVIPYGFSVAMMWAFGWSSDRSGKPVLHVALSSVLAAFGFCLAAMAPSDVGVITGFSLAASGMFAGLSTFWAVPPLLLEGTAAAGGLALIGTFGNLSGLVGPYAVGWLKQHTGDYHSGMWLCASTQLLAAMLILWLGRSIKSTHHGRT
jgi:ACS family tartrate transporter-like MFS transporter